MARGLSSRNPTHRTRSESLGCGNGNRKQPVVAREEFPTLGIDFVWVREALDIPAQVGNAMFTIVAAMREESGSLTPMEWKAVRQISLRTTVLAANTRPGTVSNWRAVRVLKTNDQGGNRRGEHADPQTRQLVRDAQLPSLRQSGATSALLVDAEVLCASRRCVCILALEPGAEGGPVAACPWSVFGLHLVDDPATVTGCGALLGEGQRDCAPW